MVEAKWRRPLEYVMRAARGYYARAGRKDPEPVCSASACAACTEPTRPSSSPFAARLSSRTLKCARLLACACALRAGAFYASAPSFAYKCSGSFEDLRARFFFSPGKGFARCVIGCTCDVLQCIGTIRMNNFCGGGFARD